jgi:H+-translocating NAD(P) transhydrogenase subunit alpha
MSLFTEITIFVLAVFVGFEVISKVPTTLHTPLMSQTNAIHGIVMLGGLIVVGFANDGVEYVIGTIAIAFGTINIVGGFMVTDRMLGMFAKKKSKPAASSAPAQAKESDMDSPELQGGASAPTGEPGDSPAAGAAGSEEG